jgi:hypothetical protein
MPLSIGLHCFDLTKNIKYNQMSKLNTDVVDLIIMYTDIATKERMYDSGLLQELVSSHMMALVKTDIMNASKEKHKQLLEKCLQCLQYHVWDDGTPMKNRQTHRMVW